MDKYKKRKDTQTAFANLFSGENFISQSEKFLKSKNKQAVIIILIIGVVFMMLPKTNKTISADGEEKRVEGSLSQIEGVGRVSLAVTYSVADKNGGRTAKGAVITADGAGSEKIKNELSEAACAALDLPAHKVKVFKKK